MRTTKSMAPNRTTAGPLDFLTNQCCTLATSMRRFLDVSGRSALAGLVMFASLGLASCTKIESRDLIREANAAYKDGRYEEAVELYDEAEELEPDGVTLFWNRACAAEAQVLRLKKPEEAEERSKFADLALKDYQTWYDRLENKTAHDEEVIKKRRLAILEADERCDDLITYWEDRHRANPKEEALYGKISRIYGDCGREDESMQWLVKRTEDFPESAKAWYALAVRKYEPLYPDPETQLPYNENMGPAERLELANEILKLLDKATEIDPNYREAYAFKSMSYGQRHFSRLVLEEPELPEEVLETLLAREDLMLQWKQQKAVCDLDQLKECPGETPETPCCPPPPFSAEEQAADAKRKKEVLAEIEANQAEIEAANEKKNKKRRRKR